MLKRGRNRSLWGLETSQTLRKSWGPGQLVSLKLDSHKMRRRQKTPLNPSSPGPALQRQWFVAINRVKPLPAEALCLSTQMLNGCEGRKPKVNFHLELGTDALSWGARVYIYIYTWPGLPPLPRIFLIFIPLYYPKGGRDQHFKSLAPLKKRANSHYHRPLASLQLLQLKVIMVSIRAWGLLAKYQSVNRNKELPVKWQRDTCRDRVNKVPSSKSKALHRQGYTLSN